MITEEYSTKEQQIYCFEEQLLIAESLELPLFLHERHAHKDFTKILESEKRFQFVMGKALISGTIDLIKDASDNQNTIDDTKIIETIDECQNNSKAMSYRNRAILSLACSDNRGGFSPIRVVSFLKQSYFSEQNLFLVLIDSLWVWKIYDYMRHFIFIFSS